MPEVNHIDCNLEHNYVSNLEWCTRKYNELHSRKHGKKEYKPFEVKYKNGNIQFYNVKQELANELNVSSTTIRLWLHKKNKGYLKYNIQKIEYVNL